MTTTTTTTNEEKEEEEMTLEQEMEVKRQLVLNTVKKYCTSDSEFSILSQIGKYLEEAVAAEVGKEGEKEGKEENGNGNDLEQLLECKIIAGGKTNYSYKLFLKNDPSKALFAKIGFDFALWNPDRSVVYDVKRMSNEFEIMQKVSALMKEDDSDDTSDDTTDDTADTGDGGFTPIAQPYHLIDIDAHSKVLITEWTSGDEQWANQFIDGIVDKRVLPKLAKTLATLHTTNDFDPMFNDTTRPIVTSLRPLFKDIFGNTIDSYGTSAADPYDTSIQVAVKEIGQNEFNQMIDSMLDSFLNDRHCLVHNDAHCFNILVEKKPSISTLENFGPDANIFLVDWEMAVVGPHGVDPGKVLCYPIACAICHAMNGHKLEAYHILDCINEFWNHYESDLIDMRNGSSSSSSIDEEAEEVVVAAVEAADDDDSGGEAFMIDLYRLTLGWTSFMIYNAFYQLNLFHDTMPVQDLSLEHNSRAKGSYASVALKLMKFAHGSDRPTGLSLEKSKAFFNDLMTTEMDELLAIAAAAASKQHPRNKGRRSSMLRTTGKRVSVSEEMIAEVQRRMSSQHLQTEL